MATGIPENEGHAARSERTGRDWRLLVLALALAVRGGTLWLGLDRLRQDPDGYRELALAVRDQGVFGYGGSREGSHEQAAIRPTAYRPPLYPLVLTLFGWSTRVSPGSVALLHLLAGVATVDLVYRTGCRWRGPALGVTASLAVACDPLLLNQSQLVMTETLATLLAAGGLLCLGRLDGRPAGREPRALLAAGVAGGVLAVAALCRPTFLAWLAAAGMTLCYQTWLRQRRPGETAVFLVTGLAVLLPWAVRNREAFGRPIITTTHGGYTLWLANNEDFYRFLDESPRGAVWDSRDLDREYCAVRRQAPDELAADRWARGQAWSAIRRHPGTFVAACLFRFKSLWGLVPHAVVSGESLSGRLLRYGIGAWYACVFALAVAGAWSLRRGLWGSPWLWGMLLLLTFSAAHTVYWTNMRMRAPLMPFVCLLAGAGMQEWTRGRRDHRSRLLPAASSRATTVARSRASA